MNNSVMKIALLSCFLVLVSCGKSKTKTELQVSELGVTHGECNREVVHDVQGLFDSCGDIADNPSLEDRQQYIVCENKTKSLLKKYPNLGCKMNADIKGQRVEGITAELKKAAKELDIKLNSYKGSGHCGLNVIYKLNEEVLLQNQRKGLKEDEIEKLYKSQQKLVLKNLELFKKQYIGISCTAQVTEDNKGFFETGTYSILLNREVLDDITKQVKEL